MVIESKFWPGHTIKKMGARNPNNNRCQGQCKRPIMEWTGSWMKQTFAISWVFSDLIQGSLVLVKERWDWKEDLSRSLALSLSMYIYIYMYIYFSILERSHFPCVGSSSCQLLAIDRDTYNWCGWLRDDYGMTMGWLWDDYGMTMGWLWIYIKHAPDWGQRSASHRFHKNGGQSSHPRLRSTGKKHGRSCQIIAKRFPWPLPHRCGNAAHEMDGFRAGFQEHNHLSSRSCGPSAALCGLRATTLTTPCNSAHWVSVERKNKVIWFNLILLPDLSLSLNTSGYSGYRLSIGGQVDPYRAKISNLLGLWQKSLRTCQKNIVTEAADLTVQNYIMLYIYIYVHICIQIRNIFNPFRSISHICIPLKVYNVIKVFLHGFVVNFQNQLDELSCLVQYLFDLAQRDRHRKCMPKARCNEADVLLFGSSAMNAIHVFILCSWPFDAVRWEIEDLLLHSSLLHCTYRSIDLFVWVRIRCLFNDFLLTVANSYGRPNQKASSVPHHTAHLVAWRGTSR